MQNSLNFDSNSELFLKKKIILKSQTERGSFNLLNLRRGDIFLRKFHSVGLKKSSRKVYVSVCERA